MPNRSRQKGARFETDCVKQLADLGVFAKKVPLSGSLGGEHSHDLRIGRKTVECKSRKRAWMDLFGWLAKGPNFLFIKADRTETLVVMALSEFVELLRGPE